MKDNESETGASVGVCQGSLVLLSVHTRDALASVGLTPDAARALATSLIIFADLQEPIHAAASKQEKE